MIRSMIIALVSILFVCVLIFNAYLLVSVVDGVRVVRTAEHQAGRTLSCYELYETKSIDAYFYPERAFQGDVIYLTGILFPVWLGVSISLPLALVSILGRQKRGHWLPLILMAPLIIAIGLHFGALAKLVCALE